VKREVEVERSGSGRAGAGSRSIDEIAGEIACLLEYVKMKQM